MELVTVLCVYGFGFAIFGACFEWVLMRAERRKFVELRQRLFGNVVDLREWRSTQKRASRIKWKR